MSNTKSQISERVQTVRQDLAQGREKLLKQHQEGSPGIQVCTQLSDLVDRVVLDIFENALSDCQQQHPQLASHMALVPYGGYGRREMAPYSDVDLMLLHTSGSLSVVAPLAGRMVRDLSDVGVDLGFSVRTARQASQMSARDAIIFTSLVDSRYLGGSVRLFTRFVKTFSKMARRRSHQLAALTEASRREERRKYGETVFLLQPNLKRSRGGLRDLQMLRWLGFARYGQRDPDHLQQCGWMARDDYRSLRAAQEFLLRLRNELHFHAGTNQDILTREEQVRIANLLGYQGAEGVLPVEQFMRDYFHHTSNIRHIVGHFVEGARWRYPRLRAATRHVTSHRADRDFLVGPRHIAATRRGMAKVTSNLADVLRLMDLSGRLDCRIDHPTWKAIRDAMMSRDDLNVDRATAKRFLSLMSQPNRLGQLLRHLHELRVLEKLVPGFDHARGLLQFNEYHKYTVDEHSIRAVECATAFLHDDNPLGRAYRKIKNKELLHLALLVHDLGKGHSEDHSEIGARLALKVAEALFLNEADTESLCFMVHRHLMLSHLAFRRDLSDQSIVLQHASEIGSPEVLRMMFVLTCADLAAVGPGVLNQWKLEVLTDLYRLLKDELTGGLETEDRLTTRRESLRQRLPESDHRDWLSRQVQSLPLAYLEGPSAQLILDDLERLRRLPRGEALAWGRFLPERDVVEYSVGVYEDQCDGIFHRLTGALSGNGLEILSAEIHTMDDQLCLDRFYVIDPDYRGEPPAERYERVNVDLVRALEGDAEQPPSFRRVFRRTDNRSRVARRPLRVRVDNSTSDRFTIIDVFADDCPGLLYCVAKTLFDIGLSVAHAKIATYVDQVVDVFYVADGAGRKIDEDAQLRHIRDRLTDAIQALSERQENGALS